MKKVSELLKIVCFAMFTLAVATTLSSCSDDDDDNNNGGGGGNGNIKTCYFEADGQRWDFDYAFVQYDDYEVSIIFSDIDLMHYFTNPDDIERGTYFNWVNLYFEECSDIPTGTVQSSGNDVTGEPAFDIDMETHVDLYAAMNGTYDDEDDASLWYTHDWSGDRPSQMQITKLGDNSYRMDGGSLNLLSSEEHGIGLDSRKTTGSFMFEGAITTLYDGRTRSMTVVSDKSFGEWLKKLKGIRK